MTTKGECIDRSLKTWDHRKYACVDKGKKSCWNCVHSERDPDYEDTPTQPGEPAAAICAFPFPNWFNYYPEVDKAWDKIICQMEGGEFEEDATGCGFYEPLRVLFCDNCGEPCGTPLIEAPTSTLWEQSFFCSEECKVISDEKTKEMIKEDFL